MRPVAVLIVLAFGLVANSASAQSGGGGTVGVDAQVPQTCAMQQGKIAPGSINNIAGLDGDTLRIIQFTDPATLQVRAASVTISFDAVCNFPHSVRIESQNNGLWPVDQRVSGRPAGFAFAVPYTARVTWGPVNALFDATAKVRSPSQQVLAVNEPVAGEFNVRLQIDEGASNVETRAPLLAGSYVDTVRIFLEPR